MFTEPQLHRRSKKILKLLHRESATLDIFLLPHAEMRQLKARFFKKQTEPNVLSFVEPVGFPHPEKKKKAGGSRQRAGGKYIGEVYLNKNILAKSPERAMPLLLHGILHLLGYDHKKKKDGAVMENLESRILKMLSGEQRSAFRG